MSLADKSHYNGVLLFASMCKCLHYLQFSRNWIYTEPNSLADYKFGIWNLHFFNEKSLQLTWHFRINLNWEIGNKWINQNVKNWLNIFLIHLSQNIDFFLLVFTVIWYPYLCGTFSSNFCSESHMQHNICVPLVWYICILQTHVKMIYCLYLLSHIACFTVVWFLSQSHTGCHSFSRYTTLCLFYDDMIKDHSVFAPSQW